MQNSKKGIDSSVLQGLGMGFDLPEKKELKVESKMLDEDTLYMEIENHIEETEEELREKQEKALEEFKQGFKGELTAELEEQITNKIKEELRQKFEEEKERSREEQFEIVAKTAMDLEDEVNGNLEIVDTQPQILHPTHVDTYDAVLQNEHEKNNKLRLTNQTLNNHGTINQQQPTPVVVNNYIGQQPGVIEEEKVKKTKSFGKSLKEELLKPFKNTSRWIVKILAFIILTAIFTVIATIVVNVFFPESVPVIKEWVMKILQWMGDRIQEYRANN